MTAQRRDEIIELLDGDIASRPSAAPGVGQLIAHVRGIARTSGALLIEFDQQSAQTLESFVEDERRCCADIGWDIERGPGLRLRITAAEGQLKAIESLWQKPTNIESYR